MKTTVIDRLEWQTEDDGVLRTWYDAQKYAASMGDGWRLPTINELISIVDYSKVDPACSSELKFSSSIYWSGSNYVYYQDNAWIVGFYAGSVGWDNKRNCNYVRCVRERGGMEMIDKPDEVLRKEINEARMRIESIEFQVQLAEKSIEIEKCRIMRIDRLLSMMEDVS